MNLIAYDLIIRNIDRTKSWVSIKEKRIYSSEIELYPCYTLAKRYNKEKDNYDYFIIVGNITKEDCSDRRYLTKDDHNRARITIKSIWKELGFDKEHDDFQIPIKVVEKQDDGIIYKIVC